MIKQNMYQDKLEELAVQIIKGNYRQTELSQSFSDYHTEIELKLQVAGSTITVNMTKCDGYLTRGEINGIS